jgi:hypothetical protein
MTGIRPVATAASAAASGRPRPKAVLGSVELAAWKLTFAAPSGRAELDEPDNLLTALVGLRSQVPD